MPKYPMRSMLVAPKDHVLIEWDLSQAETWVVAYLANEEKMKHSLHFGDIHTDTSSVIFTTPIIEVTDIQRFLGKKGNHQLSYGSTHYKLAQSINAESDQPPFVTVSLHESKVIYDGWHELYTNVKDVFWADVRRQLDLNRVLITPYGRHRTFFAAWGDELFKESYAYIPQSTVADHLNGRVQPELGIEGGLLHVKRRFVDNGPLRIVNQSHDSFIGECHSSVASDLIDPISDLLRRPIVIAGEEFTIPVDCKIGDRWGELEKVETN